MRRTEQYLLDRIVFYSMFKSESKLRDELEKVLQLLREDREQLRGQILAAANSMSEDPS